MPAAAIGSEMIGRGTEMMTVGDTGEGDAVTSARV